MNSGISHIAAFTSRTQESRSESVLLLWSGSNFRFARLFRQMDGTCVVISICIYVDTHAVKFALGNLDRFPRANTRNNTFHVSLPISNLVAWFVCFYLRLYVVVRLRESKISLSLCLSTQWARMVVASCTLRGTDVWYRLSTPLLFIESGPGAFSLGRVHSHLKNPTIKPALLIFKTGQLMLMIFILNFSSEIGTVYLLCYHRTLIIL